MDGLTPGMSSLLSLACGAFGLVFITLVTAVRLVALTDTLTVWWRETGAARFGEWIHKSPWEPPTF